MRSPGAATSEARHDDAQGCADACNLFPAETGLRKLSTQRANVAAAMEKCVAKAGAFVILCVDDDPVGLMSRRQVLASVGYEVLTAVSGAAALRLLRRRAVDLVITDHFLPGMTGVELAAAAKVLNPQLPVVLLTGWPDPPAGAEQADLFLVKGMDPPEFLAVIAKLLETK